MGRNYFGLCGQRPSQEVTSELRRCGRGKEKKSCTLSVQAAGAATELARKGGGTHLGFAKNQTISSLESEQGHVRKMWKRQLGLMKSKGWASTKIRSQVFLFWLERCRGPQGKLLRAVLVQTACRF